MLSHKKHSLGIIIVTVMYIKKIQLVYMYMIFHLLILDRKRAQMENEDEEEIGPPGKSHCNPPLLNYCFIYMQCLLLPLNYRKCRTCEFDHRS